MNLMTTDQPPMTLDTPIVSPYREGFHTHGSWADHFGTTTKTLSNIRKRELIWSKDYDER